MERNVKNRLILILIMTAIFALQTLGQQQTPILYSEKTLSELIMLQKRGFSLRAGEFGTTAAQIVLLITCQASLPV